MGRNDLTALIDLIGLVIIALLLILSLGSLCHRRGCSRFLARRLLELLAPTLLLLECEGLEAEIADSPL